MVYDKNSKEYRENGLYEIDGVLWYSIWTFKNKFGGSRSLLFYNLTESVELSKKYKSISIVADTKGIDSSKAFREEDLKEFYEIKTHENGRIIKLGNGVYRTHVGLAMTLEAFLSGYKDLIIEKRTKDHMKENFTSYEIDGVEVYLESTLLSAHDVDLLPID